MQTQTQTTEQPHIIGMHHVAIICSDYAVSRHFYTHTLGFAIVAENHQAERQSHKLDLSVGIASDMDMPRAQVQIELFHFPNAPKRASYPEANGLRHVAFAVADVEKYKQHLHQHHITTEEIRTDGYTGRRFFFCADPDGLPLEFYETPTI